jgi:hypothetical protein
VVLAGVALFAPSLGVGFLIDDVYHLAILERFDRLDDVEPLSFYTFEEGKLQRMGPIQGRLPPWWAGEDFRQVFFRPLSCLIHMADHALWGRAPVGYHVTNLLLWALLLAVVVLLYRSLSADFAAASGATVFLAGLLFAMDDAHVLNVAWLAHRYALVGAIFTVLSLLFYHRFRTGGGAKWLVICLGTCALGLFSDEGTVGLLFWVAAYELCMSDQPLPARLKAAAPLAVLVTGYVIAYGLSGMGTAGSENYVSPLSDPLRFIRLAFTERIPALLAGAFTPLPAQTSFTRVTTGAMWPLLAAWGIVLALLIVFVPHLRKDRLARFMALGALLSLIPRAGAFAHDRMLLLPTVGTAWVLASFAVASVRRSPGMATWVLRALALVIVAYHGLVSPGLAVHATLAYGREAERAKQSALASELPGPGQAEGARVLLLATPSVGYNVVAGLRWLEGLPYPEAVWGVTTGKGEYLFSRTGERTFRIQVRSDGFLRGIEPRHCRRAFDYKQGDRFRQGAMRVTLTRMEAGEIREFEVEIDRPLDHPDVWLMMWDGRKLVRNRLPPWTP